MNLLVERCSTCSDPRSSPTGLSVWITSRPALEWAKSSASPALRRLPMPDLLEKTGRIVFLRAHDLGTAYGPPNDQLDVEAVFILNALGDGAYGFQLRNDDNLPARQAMFSLLRDAFVNDLTVITDYLIDPGKTNGIAIRVALTR